MATLTIRGWNGTDEAQATAADTLVGSTLQSHGGTALTLNASTTNVLLQVGGTTVLTIAAGSLTCAQPLVMGGYKITGCGAGTTANDVITWPVPAGALTSVPAASVSGVLTVANGGTGTNSLNIYQLLAGANTANVASLPTGAAGLPLISGGPSAYASFLGDWVTANLLQATLGSTTSITNPSGTAQQIVGLQIPLTVVGTYLLLANVRSALSASTAGATITGQLHNDTAGVPIGPVSTLNQANGPSSQFSQTTAIVWGVVRVAIVPSNITLWTTRTGTGFATSSLPVDSGGTSAMIALPISNQ